jgi:hypothetical protein
MYARAVLPLVLAAAALALPAGASAQVRSIQVASNATASCQGALPNFEGAIRKRPLAVQNEGNTAAFVTCSLESHYDTSDVYGVTAFGAYLVNRSNSPRTVTCTGVAGVEGNDNAPVVYMSRTVTVAASGGPVAYMGFDTGDNGGEAFYPVVSMSCNLPPGAGIADTHVDFDMP